MRLIVSILTVPVLLVLCFVGCIAALVPGLGWLDELCLRGIDYLEDL